ncbi:DgyrCDS20 [Dimorphilus gyrociliatus]|uniref:DgyrCDS20 n=1 Tax=Dimorphilus gyrociliatus TaxID=2664684 RepID=A0A7I8V4X4_9ANNE|nr:DgyrCDS20 [Dimorphilus gyrociliatus]
MLHDKMYYSASTALEDYINEYEGKVASQVKDRYERELIELFATPTLSEKSLILNNNQDESISNDFSESLQITSTPMNYKTIKLTDPVHGLSPIGDMNSTIKEPHTESTDTQREISNEFGSENERRRLFVRQLIKEIEDDVSSIASSRNEFEVVNWTSGEDETTEMLLKKTQELCARAERCFYPGMFDNNREISDSTSLATENDVDISLLVDEINNRSSENTHNQEQQVPYDELQASISRGEEIAEGLSNSIRQLLSYKNERIASSESLEKAVYHLNKLKSLMQISRE